MIISSARFRVRSAGPQVSFQDIGRAGNMRFGVPQSGPMDRLAYRAAHAALGQPDEPTAIEVSLGGLSLECLSGTVTFAIAGGQFGVSINGQLETSWCVKTIGRGEILDITPGPSGSWCYIVFAGNIETDRWIDSAATHLPSNFGGGMISKHQEFMVERCEVMTASLGEIKLPTAESRNEFRVVIGPQNRHFDPQSLDALTTQEFAFTGAYDRMGAKLNGPTLTFKEALSIPSEPIMRGSIQVAGDGTATVLLADHQTTGGYPKIATVISADLDRFVQMRAPAKLRFVAVTPEDAVAAARAKAKETQEFLRQIRSRLPSPMTALLRETEPL